ncbi:alpha/beta fold hydrolase [Nocardia grenadensis]|uniref:alpha/beta fold hydrolase n=1 Tax=Nocardia grenadensis TaxID=931537 RepID=UPI0007A4CE06|nr:alpha/beta fold hydrolase [Nocardia grenadensis]
MRNFRTGRLPVPGATLYYEIRGTGPLLLLLQGGDGNTARAADLAGRLATDYTVVVPDRRGLSGSALDDPAVPVTVATHADDIHRLLAALTDEPARIFGSSYGALIALTLAGDHPEQVHTLIAHDPATMGLLPAAARERAERDLAALDEVHRRDGALPALRKLAELVHADSSDREPGVAPPAPRDPGDLRDLDFFLSRDLPEIRSSALDAAHIAALAATPVHIVPAAGRGSREIWNYDCTRALATLLDSTVTEFPGGHSLSTHPAAFTARLREVLRDAERTPTAAGPHNG